VAVVVLREAIDTDLTSAEGSNEVGFGQHESLDGEYARSTRSHINRLGLLRYLGDHTA
jgi:hypothetical protein